MRTTAGTETPREPVIALPWKRREDHPDSFTDGDQYLVAVAVIYHGGPAYWEYSVITIKCDEESFGIDCNDEPWGWGWDDAEHYIRLSEFRVVGALPDRHPPASE